ncbi:MAG TPA: serine/threonine-protein kinase [Dongiaceae bacterium]|nr:serine/threonine-protein kinase [Dongiaceae bacterium]
MIGRYEIESLLGKGAMGVVFLAHDPHLGRQVALKTYQMPDGISEERAREFQERLLREAHAAARLSHPNIVTVHDVGIDPDRGFPYIVFEYVEGPSLKDLLDGRSRLSPDLALRFGDGLAAALTAAHRAGVVHRDIKPANLLVRREDGVVKITDFGVARLAASELTRTGALVGSPAYMSPEQIRGGAVDARSDLFSLAVVLYEMLTSKRPFGGEDLPAVAYAVAHETPVPVTQQVDDLPPLLDAFFDRALAKDPDKRFPDGESFRKALAQAAASSAILGSAASSTPGAKRGRATRAAAAARKVAQRAAAEAAAGAADDADAPGVDTDAPMPPPTGAAGLFAHKGLVAIVVFFLLTVIGVPVLFATRGASLKLEAKSGLESGALILKVDGKPVFERRLAAPHQEGIDHLLGRNQEAFEAWLKVPSGKHALEAEVEPEGGGEPMRDLVVLELAPGESRTLRLTLKRGLGRPVQMKVD